MDFTLVCSFIYIFRRRIDAPGKGLPHTGNKDDLVARVRHTDKQFVLKIFRVPMTSQGFTVDDVMSYEEDRLEGLGSRINNIAVDSFIRQFRPLVDITASTIDALYSLFSDRDDLIFRSAVPTSVARLRDVFCPCKIVSKFLDGSISDEEINSKFNNLPSKNNLFFPYANLDDTLELLIVIDLHTKRLRYVYPSDGHGTETPAVVARFKEAVIQRIPDLVGVHAWPVQEITGYEVSI